MIEIKFNPKIYELTIDGHAGYEEKGKDIVCAAVSILFYTLAQALTESEHMLDEKLSISNDDGNGHIICKPKKEYEQSVCLIYWTVLQGFQLMTGNYKENVSLRIVG